MSITGQMRRRYNHRKDPYDPKDMPFSAHRMASDVLAAARQAESDTHMMSKIPPHVDQLEVGMCGGCGGSRAGKLYMNEHGYPWQYTPSANFLYDIARMIDGVDLSDDSGVNIRSLFKAWNQYGIAPEDSNEDWSWPFAASGDHWKTMPPEAVFKDALMHKVEYMRLGSDPDEMKAAIMQGFPVVIGITVHESFESQSAAKTGIIPHPGHFDPILGGHCMYAVAFEDRKWVVPNSWGPDWGSGGNALISFRDMSDPDFCSDRWAITNIA